jgi:polysaccharide biosynthesis protein PslG
MKLRFALAVFSGLLALFTSADHKSSSCSECWQPARDIPTVEQTLGVNIHFTDAQPGEVKMIAEAGFRWVRMDFKWDLTERERGRYDFSPYERLLKSLDEFQIRALFILDYGNPLYTEDKAVRTPEARAAFARWAAAAAKHFSGRGVLWEIFNEPNIKIFWPPTPNESEYTALALEVGRAFQTAAPNEKLMGPATSGIEFRFLEACFKADLLNYWSAVSVHPYRQRSPESAAAEYALLRVMVLNYRSATDSNTTANQRDIPLISGEWGYSSAWPGMNEDKQAAMLARTLLTNAANGIPLSIWYDWRDDGPDPKEPEHHFGLVRQQYRAGQSPVYDPKPAYLAARTLSEQLKGYRFVERLTVGSDDDYVMVFGNRFEQRIVAWTTSASSHPVTIPSLNGAFNLTSLNGESGGHLTSDRGRVVIQVSTAPIYLIQTGNSDTLARPR